MTLNDFDIAESILTVNLVKPLFDCGVADVGTYVSLILLVLVFAIRLLNCASGSGLTQRGSNLFG